MRFKTDENIPVEAVQILASHGHDVLSVIDQHLEGQRHLRQKGLVRDSAS